MNEGDQEDGAEKERGHLSSTKENKKQKNNNNGGGGYIPLSLHRHALRTLFSSSSSSSLNSH